MWSIGTRGFLPNYNPLSFLPVNDFRNTKLIYTWENLSSNLATFIEDRCIREELISQLREVSNSYYHGFVDNIGGQNELERAFYILSFFAVAYLNAYQENKKFKIPKEITMPFVRCAHLVRRNPVLDYHSYVLYNWKKDSDKEFEPMMTFTSSDSEKIFIKSFIQAEVWFGEVISNFDLLRLNEILTSILNLWSEKWDSMDTKGFVCYFDMIENVKYEGWDDRETKSFSYFLTYPPFLSLLNRLLGIKYTNSELVKVENNLVHHRPESHMVCIRKTNSIRKQALEDDKFGSFYNECLDKVVKLYSLIFSDKFYPNYVELNSARLAELNGHFVNKTVTFS